MNINEGLVCNSGKKCVSGNCIVPIVITDLAWGYSCNDRCSAIGKTCISIGRDDAASDGNYNKLAEIGPHVCAFRIITGGSCSTVGNSPYGAWCGEYYVYQGDGYYYKNKLETRCRCL